LLEIKLVTGYLLAVFSYLDLENPRTGDYMHCSLKNNIFSREKYFPKKYIFHIFIFEKLQNPLF